MKRILIASTVLAVAAGIFCSLKAATEKLRLETRAERNAWEAQTQKIAQISVERSRFETHLEELSQQVDTARQTDPGATAAGTVPKPGAKISPQQREKLLAELGFNWNNTGDYVVVSKDTLRAINLEGVKRNKLSGVARDVLAMTPEELESIDATLQRVAADYQTWAQSHVQRTEPSGDVVAKYTLPADAEVSQSLSNTVVSGMFNTLGQERGELLETYSARWMQNLGLLQYGFPDSPTTLIVKRYQAGDETHLGLELRHGGNTMSTDVSPWQPVPEAFQPLFPGGWPDLARREGFGLPKAFNKP